LQEALRKNNTLFPPMQKGLVFLCFTGLPRVFDWLMSCKCPVIHNT